MNLELNHNGSGLPIHANGLSPHITVRDYGNRGTWHVPYYGQTTLGMYGVGQPGESLAHVDKYNLGGLHADSATFRRWA